MTHRLASHPVPGFLRYWGKSIGTEECPEWHLLAFHCLDVAAVGRVLLERDPARLQQLSDPSGLPCEEALRTVIALLALHDIGKFSLGFQTLRPEILESLHGSTRPGPAYGGPAGRHDALGKLLLRELWARGVLSGGARPPAWEAVEPWICAVAGHHGEPVEEPRVIFAEHFPGDVLADATEFAKAAMKVVDPEQKPFLEAAEDLEDKLFCSSWLVAGVAVASDWIGSNGDWFPFESGPVGLQEYWVDKALPRAQRAVTETGILPVAAAQATGFHDLFPDLKTATPAQVWADEVPLGDGPQMFVLEEVTGGGKTEAAVTLAARLMARGLADGIYVALPTMATANAMYARLSLVYQKLFRDPEKAVALLSHSSSRLALNWATAHGQHHQRVAPDDGGGACAAWLYDSRKKALLAHVGVGTIDQALMAVLPVRHQSLRLHGLVRHVLLVDEVHACDDYVQALLERLLHFHARLGGSAILLSATLPRSQRARLVEAFSGSTYDLASSAYPLATTLVEGTLCESTFAARAECRRRVDVHLASDLDEAMQTIEAAVRRGECACWIRNTVDDAREAYQAFRQRVGEDRVTLLHARFTLADRWEKESDVLQAFGPKSTHEERRGRLVIATQVIEQSLDLDFDVMVSDLAPADLLVQRAGRLRRHRRDELGNRCSGPDRRGPATLTLLGPMPDDTVGADWYRAFFPRGAFVYPDHARLWCTARWLADHEGFRVPEDLRDFIEYVYAEELAARAPSTLRRNALAVEGQEKADRAWGRQETLVFEDGYMPRFNWTDDAHPRTRLGEPTVALRLLCSGREGIRPLCHPDSPLGWLLSEVQVRKFRADSAVPETQVDELQKQMPDEGRFSIPVVLRSSGGVWLGAVIDARGRRRSLSYSFSEGLVWLNESQDAG